MKNFLEDVNLLVQISCGDSKCFESLLHKYKDKVFGFCLKMTGDRAMAEDLAQDTWIKVVQNAHSFHPEYGAQGKAKAQVSTWILRIARNLTLNEIKKRKWEDLDDSQILESTQDPAADIEVLLSAAQDRELISQAIEKLPEQSRVVLTLWMSEDVSHSQIAEDLGITVAHVKVILFRTKKLLLDEIRGKL